MGLTDSRQDYVHTSKDKLVIGKYESYIMQAYDNA